MTLDSDLAVHGGDGGDTDILSSSNNSTCDSLSETEEDLSLQGAKVIITVVFSAIRYSDVAKQQLVSAAKKFRLSCNFASKDSMAMALAKTFLKENFVKVDSANLQDIDGDNVQKLKVY
ncbi:uncharacterized protein [Pocillopora verrucosa]|uniref:uncharacterized protein n=1 Tax=Pocillopora verrucosa TaxID=203993 RepID=UPI00333FB403